MSKVIEGLKVIYQTGGVNLPDDQTFPYRFYMNLRPPGMMEFAFVMMYGGSEEIVVKAMTKEAIIEFIDMNGFRTHPRLRRFDISGPDGKIEEFERK